MNTNHFCSRSNFSNEASVETWFVDPLLKELWVWGRRYQPEDLP